MLHISTRTVSVCQRVACVAVSHLRVAFGNRSYTCTRAADTALQSMLGQPHWAPLRNCAAERKVQEGKHTARARRAPAQAAEAFQIVLLLMLPKLFRQDSTQKQTLLDRDDHEHSNTALPISPRTGAQLIAVYIYETQLTSQTL